MMLDAAISDFALTATGAPDDALDMAATLIVDTVGVGAGAAKLEAGRIARAHAFAHLNTGDPDEGATMLFDGRRASIPGSAFALASQIDNLDAHDGWNASKGHASCALVPALFAFAETRPELTGPEALEAYLRGYEIAVRASLALHATVSDYHTSGAWNALGVAAIGSRLLRLDAGQFRHALGIAEYHGPRSQMMREIANPTMLHDGSGMGALVGAMATLMARDGFTGAPAITVEQAPSYWEDLGADWLLPGSYIKPYPICRWAHGALDALSNLIADHKLEPQNVARLEVRTFAESAQLFAGMPQTTSQAQYSLGFALASMLKHRQVGPAHITGEALTDPDIAAILPRIEVSECARHSARFPQGRWSDITVTLLSGETLTSGDVNAKGGPERPMPLGEVEEKFHLMASDLPDSRRRQIWAMRDRMQEPDMRFSDLADLLHAPI